MKALTYLARRFVAGEEMSDAMKAVTALNRDSILTTLDILGENVSSGEEADAAARGYLDLIDGITRHGVKSNVSLKLTQMGLDISDEFCRDTLQKIVSKARANGNFVRVDMEGSAYTDRTLAIFKQVYGEFKNVGIVVQAALHRTEKDVEELGRLKASVRVCKGAYKEPPSVAFQDMDDIRGNYKIIVESLICAGSKVAVATHDESLIRWMLEWSAQEKIPREQFEFQMLYGLRRKRARQLAAQGYTVRLYVPFGSHWFPYFYRRLRERKENLFAVLKGLIAD